MNDPRTITMHLTENEAKVLCAAVRNGQLAGRLHSINGMKPSQISEVANDLFDRLLWLLDDTLDDKLRILAERG